MDLNYGYHITNKSNIYSILKNGLLPNIGKNSRSVGEQNFLIYFTTFNFIDTWIERFKLDKTQIVILKFPCVKEGQRYDSANDCFTFDIIPPESISVIDNGEEFTLEKFYQKNKSLFDLEIVKNANTLLKTIIERLKQIEFTSLEPEQGWDYNEVDPNLIDILELLKIIRDLDNKKQFTDVLNSIKDQTLKKLCVNNLGITTESKIYKLLDTVFTDSLSNNPQFDLMLLNVLTVLVSVNMFYRQLDRYKRTSKKYGDENEIWNIDTLSRNPINDIINNNFNLKDIMDEIIILHSNKEHVNNANQK